MSKHWEFFSLFIYSLNNSISWEVDSLWFTPSGDGDSDAITIETMPSGTVVI